MKRKLGILKWSAPILFFAVILLGASCSSREPQASSAVEDSSGKTTQDAQVDDRVQLEDGNPSGSQAGKGGDSSSRSSTRTAGAGRSPGVAGSLIGGDGEVVAFNRACGSDPCDAPASQTKIHRISADGSDDRSLVTGIAPSWSRDGKRVAFGTNYFGWGGSLKVMNSDGSDLQGISPYGTFPRWSPDGLKLVFNWPCQSPAWPADPANCWQYSEAPRAYGCGPAECGIGVIRVDGGGPERLGNGIWPDWGPDGRIVFTDGTPIEPCQYGTAYWYYDPETSRESDYRLPSCALPLWVMNADGSGRTALPIAKATAPKWSPDGKRIAYHVETEGVFIANADGTGSVKVAPVGFMDPSWSSDGKRLALTRRTSDAFTWSTFVRAVDGSGEKQLTFGARDTLPSYSPDR